MCSDDVPPGVVARPPDPQRRQFLRAGLAGGGLAAASAALAACTKEAPDEARSTASTTSTTSTTIDPGLDADVGIVHQTYTGVAEADSRLPLRSLIEVTDAAAPSDALLGVHRVVWNVGTTQPMVALTVDDGPDPRFTPRVLEALAAAGAKATFFMMGYNVEKHTDLAKAVLAAGHDIGNHTWSHQDLAFQDPPSARKEIKQCKAVLSELLGSDTTYFRPPRGELSGAVIRIASAENYDTFLWSVSRNDPAAGTPEVIADHVVSRLRPGAIIDMHDSIGRGLFLPRGSDVTRRLLAAREVDVRALPLILEKGQAAGLRFVTLTELLAAATDPGALTPALAGSAGRPTGPTTTPPT
jgi:peptidoglycan/xylan/chitin deacetylase (PgdA/CDA1 family)